MITLFVGRFQPFHKGHLQDIINAIKFSSKIIIAIGSKHEKNTALNPFSFEERKDMITQVIEKYNFPNYEIIGIPDVNSDSKWVEHVKNLVGEIDLVYSGNPKVIGLWKEAGYKVKEVVLLDKINATIIRERIDSNKDWSDLVPREIYDFVKNIDGEKRIKNINGKT